MSTLDQIQSAQDDVAQLQQHLRILSLRQR